MPKNIKKKLVFAGSTFIVDSPQMVLFVLHTPSKGTCPKRLRNDLRSHHLSSASMPASWHNVCHHLVAEGVELAGGRVFLGVRRELRLHLAAKRCLADSLDYPVAHHAQGVRHTPFAKGKEASWRYEHGVGCPP